jgi:hypothetical protein
MVLEGAMMTVAVLALTIGHPGPIMGSLWHANALNLCKGIKAAKKATEKVESVSTV